MKRLKLTSSWWRPGKDLDTVGLVKFFSLPGFVVILVFTVILTVLLTLRAQQMALKKNEDYLILLASNLNHQIYQQFLLPTALEKGGRITLSDPEQAGRLDMVVRNTIHGFHVEQLNQYDQEGVFSYSTASVPLGKKCADVVGVQRALAGENYFELPGYSIFWSIFWPRSYQHQTLTAYIPFRQEEQRRLEAQLPQSERLAALGEMTAGVAHEVRNPLGIISSTAELLQARLARYEPKNRLAQIIVAEPNRLNEKVTEFLDFARPRVPNLRPCDLEATLNRGLELLAPEIDRLGIKVTREYQLNGQALMVDQDLLYQAFLNILLNAIQAWYKRSWSTMRAWPLSRISC